jgi:UDP-N-acetylglucosamine 1-carboxyvinyltransferase
MTTWSIEGGTPLVGSIQLTGAKNSITKLLMLSMLTEDPCIFTNTPDVGDSQITLDLCSALGAQYSQPAPHELEIQTRKVLTSEVPYDLATRNRLAIMTTAPLLHRTGRAIIPAAAGGDRIGPRPVDFHLQGFQQMGAEVDIHDGLYDVRADRLRGADIVLPYPSVTTTENLLMGASLAKGRTFIHNAAVEPEVIDLVMCLQKMGAIIDYNTDRTFVIEGVASLNGVIHEVIPDRIVAASLACAAVATQGNVLVQGARQADLVTFLNTIRRVGGQFDVQTDGIRFYYDRPLSSIAIETNVHPGFMTDWQAPFVLLLTQANGMSVVHETVFESRFGYIPELQKMGADIALYDSCLGGSNCRFRYSNYRHSCVIKGPTPLQGARMEVPDLRAGFTYLIAAILAQGQSIIGNVEQIERGYEGLKESLISLGARIEEIR